MNLRKDMWFRIAGAALAAFLLVGVLVSHGHYGEIPQVQAQAVAPPTRAANSNSGQHNQAVLGVSTPSKATTPSVHSQTAATTTQTALATITPTSSDPVVNAPPADPPPPVICNRYDVCGAHQIDEDQGIAGAITIGPTTPVCHIDTPCSSPYMGTVNIRGDNDFITQTSADEQGQFNISLQPGTYHLSLPGIGFHHSPGSSEQVVVVYAELYTYVNLDFDTGIR